MKLYNEEHMSVAINAAKANPEQSYLILALLKPIELPSDQEIWRWWQTQKFQKEQGEQEYTMIYEIDLPKILKAFIEHFSKIQGGNNEQQ
jgi:hypothetical protein